MTATAGSVQIGQHVRTIPSVATGRTTSSGGTVTSVERFEIMGHQFVDLRMSAEHLTLTLPANTLVETA